MGNRFAEMDAKPGNRFASTAKPKKNRFAVAEDPLAAVEQQVEESGASSFKDTLWTGARIVGDLVSRPNYAVAGAAEELFAPQGGGIGAVLPRVGSEILSGIGGIQGQKEGFAQVMEQAGVGQGGSLSDLAPFLYNDDPNSWLSRGGALDPSVRGFAGLAGDVFLDPTTYLGFGAAGKLSKLGKTAKAAELLKPEVQQAARVAAREAFQTAERQAAKFLQVTDSASRRGAYSVIYEEALKSEAEKSVRAMAEANPALVSKGGVTFLGHTVPGTPVLNAAKASIGEAATKALSATPAGQSALSAVASFRDGVKSLVDVPLRLIQHGRDVKEYKGVIEAEQKLNANLGAQVARWNTALKELSDKYALTDLEKAHVVRAVDAGDFSKLRDARLQEAAGVVRDKGQQILETDLATGLQLAPVPNYIHHAYHDAPDKVAAVISRYQPQWVVRYGDQGFLEKRVFKTLDDAEKAGLHPIYDPWELLRKRGTESLKARTFRTYEQAVTRLTGEAETWRVADAFDMTMRGKRAIQPAESARIAEILHHKSGDIGPWANSPGRFTSTADYVSDAPEYRVAKRRLRDVEEKIPLRYAEEQRLKNADEVRYYRRRGWDVIEEGKGDMRAFRPRGGVHSKEYVSWQAERAQARREVAAAQKRAVREFRMTVRAPKFDKAREIGKLSDEAKRAYFEERFAKAGSAREILLTIDKYKDDFEPFFPKGVRDVTGLDPTGKPWTTINVKGLGDRSLPADVAAHVAEMNRAFWNDKNFSKMLDGYDYLTNAFKLGVTAFPAFHARNAYNNVAQSFLKVGAGIFDPSIQRDAVAMLKGHPGTFKTATGEIELSALKTAFEDAGIIVPGNTMLEYTGRKAGQGRLFENKFARAHKTIGTAIENEGRIAHALVELKSGKSLEDAVASVNQALVDYSAITKAEREVMRRVFPFYTWQRKNLEFQYRMLRENPGRVANELKPFRGRDNENEQMTSFEAGAYKIRLDGDGKTVRMISGVDLPIRNLDVLWRGNVGKTLLGVIGMTAPQLKTPLEAGFGKSAFTGRDLDRKQSDSIGRVIEHTPKAIQDWMGYKKEVDAAGRPRYTFDGQRFYVLFQSWMASRVVSTSDRMIREYAGKDEGAAGQILDLLTGLRLKNMNMAEEHDRAAKENEAAAMKALQRRGEVKEFRRYYTPKVR